MALNTIVFDLGGVLIDWNPDYVFRQVIPDEARRQYFFDNVCTHDWNMEQDAGRLIEVATTEKVKEWPDWEPEIRAYYGRWEEMLGGPIHDTVDLFQELTQLKTHRLLALTNWSAETFPVALGLYDFLHWFEGIVVSGTEKTRKPYPEIYKILLDRYDVTPEKAVFIDDSLKNVEGARALGMHGIHFQNAAALRQALRDMAVPV